eukprot:5853904-Prymnesium_polylepis.1
MQARRGSELIDALLQQQVLRGRRRGEGVQVGCKAWRGAERRRRVACPTPERARRQHARGGQAHRRSPRRAVDRRTATGRRRVSLGSGANGGGRPGRSGHRPRHDTVPAASRLRLRSAAPG